MPHVPPSTSSTSGDTSQPSRSRSSAASPTPSSPISGVPRPMTSVRAGGSVILEFRIGRHHASAAYDRRNRTVVFEHVGTDGEVDVDGKVDGEYPRDLVMDEPYIRYPAEQRPDPVEGAVEYPGGVVLAVEREPGHDLGRRDGVEQGVAHLLQRIVTKIGRSLFRPHQDVRPGLAQQIAQVLPAHGDQRAPALVA